MKRAAAVLTVVTIVGCADPESSTLPVGSTAIVSKPDGVYINPKDKNEFLFKVDPGIRLTVGHDPGGYRPDQRSWEFDRRNQNPPADEAEIKAGPPYYPPGHELAKLRDIDVVVESGPHAGTAASIRRDFIRPSP